MSVISRVLQTLGLLQRVEGEDAREVLDVPVSAIRSVEGTAVGEAVTPTPSVPRQAVAAATAPAAAPDAAEVEPDPTELPEPTPLPPPERIRHATRSLTLDELLTATVDDGADGGALDLASRIGLRASWEAVFAAAGVALPAHGWGVDRAAALIALAQSRGMTPMQVRQSLDRALWDAGVDAREIVVDALTRDEVLDRYEEKVIAATEATLSDLATQAASLEAQIARLQDQVEATHTQHANTARELAEWRGEKQVLEDRWTATVEIVAPLISES